MSFDFEVGRCRDAELVVLEETVVRGNGTHVVEQAVDAVGGLTIQQTATLANVLQIRRAGTQQTLTNQVVVGLGVVGQNRIVLRTLKYHGGIQVQQLAPAGQTCGLVQTVSVQFGAGRGEGTDVAVLENIVAQTRVPGATKVAGEIHLNGVKGIADQVPFLARAEVLGKTRVRRNVAVHGIAVVVPVGQGIGESSVHAVVPNKTTTQNHTGRFAGFDVDVVGGAEFIRAHVQASRNGFQRIRPQQFAGLDGTEAGCGGNQRTLLQALQYVFFNAVHSRCVRTSVFVEFVFRREQEAYDGAAVLVFDNRTASGERTQVVSVGVKQLRCHVFPRTEVLGGRSAGGGGDYPTGNVAVDGRGTAGNNFCGLDGVTGQVDTASYFDTVNKDLVAVFTTSPEGNTACRFVGYNRRRHLQQSCQSPLRKVSDDFLVKGLRRFTGFHQRSLVFGLHRYDIQLVGLFGQFYRQNQRSAGRDFGAAQFVGLHAKCLNADGIGTFVYRGYGEITVKVGLALGFHHFAIHHLYDGIGNAVARFFF